MIKKLKFIIPLIIGGILFTWAGLMPAFTAFAGLSKVKTWVSSEILTHTDLNAEFSNIIDNFLTGLSPLTGNLDFNDKEALNFVLEKLGTDGTGVEGQLIYNTTQDHAKLKNDSVWTFILDVPTMGTSGQFLTTDGTDSSWASAHQSSRVIRTAGNLTTTSSTFADATGMSITITTGANPVLIGISGSGSHSGATNQCRVDIDIDGSRQGQTVGLISAIPGAGLSNISFVYQSATLTAASHTFKMQIATDAATATFNASTDQPLILWVTELK